MLKVVDIDYEHKQLRLSFKALAQNTRKHLRKVKYLGLPSGDIGFKTLKDKLPEWLEEYKENENA